MKKLNSFNNDSPDINISNSASIQSLKNPFFKVINKFKKNTTSAQKSNISVLSNIQKSSEKNKFIQKYQYFQTQKQNNYKKKMKEELKIGKIALANLFLFYKKVFKFLLYLSKFSINLFGILIHTMRPFIILESNNIFSKQILIQLEISIACLYIFEFLYDILIASSKINKFFSFKTIFEFITILPGFLYFFYGFNNKFVIFLAFFRCLRIFRIFKVLFLLIHFREMTSFDDEYQLHEFLEISEKVYNLKTELFEIISHLFSIIFISTNLLMTIQDFLERGIFLLPSDKIGYINTWQAIYFIIVTLTTLGYGDYVPIDPLVRVMLTILLIFYIAIISRDLTLLSETLKNFSAFETNHELKNHIIVIGEFSPEYFKKMLFNFYSEFNEMFGGIDFLKFLIIKNEEPSQELNKILNDINLMNNIKFLKANPNKNSWIAKSNLSKAFAIFAFADKPINVNENSFRLSQENILYICKNIKNNFQNKPLFLYMHFSMEHWSLTDWLGNTQVFYYNLFKNYFLAISIENRSVFNFLSQIIFSYNKRNQFLLPKFLGKNPKLLEFQKGFKQNLQKARISSYFIGFTFGELKKIIYFSFHSKKNKKKSPLCINCCRNEGKF